MTRVALDSNILIYAELEPDSEKGARAIDLVLCAPPPCRPARMCC